MKQHSSGFLALVNSIKKNVKEISASTLKQKIDQQEPITIIDVREGMEWDEGHIPDALHLSKGVIERDIEKFVPHDANVVVYCSGGFRSALVADNLQKMGYTSVFSLEKGLQNWLEHGFNLEYP